MESYITNRKQYVEMDGTKFDLLNITIGVHQGSILEPLLFIIYILMTLQRQAAYYWLKLNKLRKYIYIYFILLSLCNSESIEFVDCRP